MIKSPRAPDPNDVPPVVGKRNHFDFDAQTLAQTHFRQISWTAPDHERLASMLEYTKAVIRHTARYFATGAERGIEQTAKLPCDPDYFATQKERRQRERDRRRVDQERQSQERLEQRLAPTAEQIEREINNLDKWIPDSEESLKRMKERRAELQVMVPKHARIDTIKKREWSISVCGVTERVTLPGPLPFAARKEPESGVWVAPATESDQTL